MASTPALSAATTCYTTTSGTTTSCDGTTNVPTQKQVDQFQAFRSSGYSFDDMQQAMQVFKLKTPQDAERFIGKQILAKTTATLAARGITENPFDTHECMAAFQRAGYTDADAGAAQKAFSFLQGNGQTLNSAKAYIGLKVVNHYEQMLRDVGITPSGQAAIGPTRPQQLDAFRRSTYSYDDAVRATQVFDFLTTPEQAQEYIGLKILNSYEQMLAEQGITPQPFDKHEEMAAFVRGGYTPQDAALAKQKFDFLKSGSLQDAEQYIGLKVINNYEQMLRDVGIFPSGAK